jgi:hypothetical protein
MWQVRVSFFILAILSPILIHVRRIILKNTNPVFDKSVFSSDRYDASLVAPILYKEFER